MPLSIGIGISPTKISDAVSALFSGIPTPTWAIDFARDQYSTLSPALTVSSPTGGVMVPDYLGNYHKTLADEIPIRGGRRKRQLISKTEDFSDASWLVYGGTQKIGPTVVDGVPAMEVSLGTTGGAIGGASALYRSTDIAPAGVNRRVAFWVRAKSGTSSVRVEINEVVSSDTGDVAISDSVWTRIALSKTEAADGNAQIALRTNVAGNSGNVYVALATCYVGEHQDDLPDVYTSDTIEEPEYVSRGVISSPYHGYGVDGLAWMRTDPSGLALADGLGPELVTNGGPGFVNDSGWSSTTTTRQVVDGDLIATAVDGSSDRAEYAFTGLTVGATYRVRARVASSVASVGVSTIQSWTIGSINTINVDHTDFREYEFDFVCTSTSGTARFYADVSSGVAGKSIKIREFSLREVYPVPCTGIADWPQVTNLQRYSNALASWSPTNRPNVTVTSDDTVLLGRSFSRCSPSAAGTAQRYVLDVDASVVSGTTYTAQAKIKADGANSLMQITFNATRFGTGQWAFIDLADGSISSETGGSATVSPLGDGVFLVTWTAVCTSTGTSGIAFVLCSEDTGTLAPATLMDGDDDLLIADVQINAGAVALPFVPTDATAVTADAIVKTLDKDEIGYVAGGGTWVIEHTPELPADVEASNQYLLSLVGPAGDAAFLYNWGGEVGTFIFDDSAVQWSAGDAAAAWAVGTTQRIAWRLEENNGSLVTDGVERVTDTSMTVPDVSTIYLGGTSSSKYAGSIGAIAYYAAGA